MQEFERRSSLPETVWKAMTIGKTAAGRWSQVVLLFLFFCLCFSVSVLLLDNFHTLLPVDRAMGTSMEFALNCSGISTSRTCPENYYPTTFQTTDQNHLSTPSPKCPDYFRWIYEDLRPWTDTGITKEMVERAKRTANFRLVILNGRAYVETYEKAFQTRDTFTVWGILQLLRRYPGKVPDLDLMFDCVDWPVIKSNDYGGTNAETPPPLFRYCGDDDTLDIVFPDWSFWGWPETNIKPWELLSRDLREGNKKTRWKERVPYAFWKGNPEVSNKRMDLLKCNVSEKQDWNARIYSQNWTKETQQGFSLQSDLTNQCNYRYKIYIEGSAWSVSEKYILACDSAPLVVKPHYYDFFTRGLIPLQHYWPIKQEEKCKSIKFAVDWGNSHEQEAHAIGKAASNFIEEDLKMEKVYDYMLHLLTEYGKLLKYKPSIPPKASELCSEAMACPEQGLGKTFMIQSTIRAPTDSIPCTMPPPFDPHDLESFLSRKAEAIEKVEKWEESYWKNHHMRAILSNTM